ncbi:MAG: N-acetylmuramoyl-L-alanine amidase-like domain-containing protein [Chlorobiota bacterium]
MSRIKYLYISLVLVLSIGLIQNVESNNDLLSRIDKTAQSQKWNTLEYGDLIIKVGKQFLGVPYVGGTLDKGETETCTVHLDKLDCVTYFETTLAISNLIASGTDLNMANLEDEVEYTRYRDGTMDGYESRLHYTSEWIIDNVKKGIVKDITKELGGEELSVDVFFMSENSDKYKFLKNNPELTKKISEIEDSINESEFFYIPKENIADIEGKLQSGDIVAIVTTIPGLDYGHIGIINKKDGISRFMHASLTQKKVIIDKSISDYVSNISKFSGITVLRPIRPQ